MTTYEKSKKEVADAALYRHYRAVIDVMHEALHSGMWSMEFDENGVMTSVSWSDEFRRMLGYQDQRDFPDTLEAWSDKLHQDDKERVMAEYNDTIYDYSNRKGYDVEYRLRVKSGEWRWFHAMGRLIRRQDGSPETYVGMFVDITEEKETEQRLLDTLKEAEEANRAKSRFLSNMSHDIRTPLNGIMGMTDIALHNLDEPDRTKDCLHKIQSASGHLLMLVNDVLDMSRIESGKLLITHELFDLETLLGVCSDVIDHQIINRKLAYREDHSQVKHRHLVGDESHLKQIFLNVLGNAVKFTRDGGRVDFRVYETAGDDNSCSLRFEIEDTGIGMSPDYLPKIFDIFSQESSGSRTNYTGTGLGMAITKELVELMGGSIQVESQLDVGTKITIDLTFDLAETEGDQRDKESVGIELTGMKVLVAEDNEINMEIVTVLLTEMGASVTQAFNGKEAVDCFAASKPGDYDVVLMDLMMPVMNGLNATRAIRALKREDARAIPIIAATANAFEDDIRQMKEAGMDAYVSKPLDFDALILLLKTVLNGEPLREQLDGDLAHEK